MGDCNSDITRLMALVRRYAAARVSGELAFSRDAYPPTLKRYDDQANAAAAEIERELAALLERAGALEAQRRVLDNTVEHLRERNETLTEDANAFRQWWQDGKVEVARLTAESELRGTTVADLAHELGTVKAVRDRMRPVVDAACALYDCWHDPRSRDCSSRDLDNAIEAYRTSKAGQ